LNPFAPHPSLDAARAALLGQTAACPAVRSVRFALPAPWAPPGTAVDLTAVLEARAGRLRAFVTDRPVATDLPFDAAADRAAAAIVDWHAPLPLRTVDVVKPWGGECWYTGVETRGVSAIGDGRHATPLPWVLALDPAGLQGPAPLVLLKRLEPLPEPVRGDLYFELHERKREVYVVTSVDRRAWPTGVGAIRFGMNATLRARYGDDTRFRADYLAAVRRYEAVRRRIDAGACDDSTLADERTQRAGMDAFTSVCELRPGDVVQVPTQFPHALQHGVRVIELQTPVYERRILSFAQATPTQSHWDTEAAVERMRLDAPALATIENLLETPSVRIECIARFADFEAHRIRLAPNARFRLEAAGTYRLCIATAGAVTVNGLRLDAEAACLLPGTLPTVELQDATGTGAACVLAVPTI
jgi:hypothetical protein